MKAQFAAPCSLDQDCWKKDGHTGPHAYSDHVRTLDAIIDAHQCYVPTPDELDDLCAAISACGYASEAVQVVEDWTRLRWGVESAFTTKYAEPSDV